MLPPSDPQISDNTGVHEGDRNDGEHTYDYIICGGGPAGCALASRLAEDKSIQVLLIEAGEHEHEHSKVPAG